MQAAEARLQESGYLVCPHCESRVEKEFLRCPNCMRKLKDPCANGARPLDPQWPICPYCEAEVPGHAPVPRRRRRRQPTGEVEQGATASYEAPLSPCSADTPEGLNGWTGPSSWSSPTRSR